MKADDPQPGLGATVTDAFGRRWVHTVGPYGDDYWVRADDPDGEPESWIMVAGNYGPVELAR